MRSTSRRRQSGQSIVEVVVASAILGLTVVVALQTIDASIRGGRQVVHEAWAQCMVRETAGAIQEARWAPQYASPNSLDVAVAPVNPPVAGLQKVTITAHDPETGSTLYSASFLKAAALQGSEPVDRALQKLALACPKL